MVAVLFLVQPLADIVLYSDCTKPLFPLLRSVVYAVWDELVVAREAATLAYKPATRISSYPSLLKSPAVMLQAFMLLSL